MDKRHKFSSLVFSIYILFAFYSFGGGMVNSFVGYPTWRWVGANEFPKFHQVDTSLIIPVFVVPTFFIFIPLILLLWFRPQMLSKWLIGVALFLEIIVLVSTITIQIPIQMELDKRYSLQLIDQLISTDLIYRKIPKIMLTIINFLMLYKVVKHSNTYTRSTVS